MTMAMVAFVQAMGHANDAPCTVASPDGRLVVEVTVDDGHARYQVTYGGKLMVLPSALGLKADIGDFTTGLKITGSRNDKVEKTYTMQQAKVSNIHYVANSMDVDFVNATGQRMTATFLVSDNDIAFRYTIPRQKNDNPKCALIYNEATAFRFADGTTTFLCPQIGPKTGWERTKPSYEEDYEADMPMATKSKFGLGYKRSRIRNRLADFGKVCVQLFFGFHGLPLIIPKISRVRVHAQKNNHLPPPRILV